MLSTNYTEIFQYETCSWRKRCQIRDLLSEEKTTIILPSYVTAEYIKHPKSRNQCSETFINVFVFFTPHLHQRISVLHISVLHWQKSVHACPDLLQRLHLVEHFLEKEQVQSWSQWYSNRLQNFLTLAFLTLPSLALFRNMLLSFISTVRQTKEKCYGTEKSWY